MATPIDIIGGFYTVGGRSWAAQDCVNYLPMAAEVSGTKTQTMLRSPPGLRPWVNVGDGPDFAIRGMHDVEGALFVVSGSRLYQISNKGVAIPLGTIPGVGRVSMAHNQIAGGNQLLVVNGNAGYVWNTLTQTFDRVTDEGYPGASVAQFVNSYLMQLEPFGRFLFFSDLADASAYNTLDRFEAEAQPDPVVSILTDQNEVVAFGTRTMQFFENTGAAQGTFQSKGVVISRGCAGRFTPVKIDNSLAWLGDDGVFYRLDGYSPRRISTHAIEEAIAGLNWSQAFGMVWTDQGHTVAYWTFPDGQTWGFDVSSGLWHRRASYHPSHEVSRRWRPSTLIRSNGQWIAGDATSGKLFALDWDYMLEDVDQPLVSERVTQIAFNSGSRFSVDAVDLWMQTGEKSSASGIFPEQPVGPAISGQAPDGFVNLPYAGYSYTAVAGDAPIVSWRLVSGELPPNVTFANGTLSTGTPTKIQAYTFRVRVTDSNGLFADIVDTINIRFSFAAWILKINASMENRAYIEVDQATGVVAGINYDTPENLYSTDGKSFVRYESTNPIQPTGIAWSPSLGLFCTSSDANSNQFYTSTDGRSWTLHSSITLEGKRGMAWSPTLAEFATIAGPNIVRSPNGVGWLHFDVGLSGTITLEWSRLIGAYVAAGSSIYKSNAGGTSFVDQGLPAGEYLDMAESGERLVVIDGFGHAAITDNGNAWNIVDTPVSFNSIAWAEFAGRFVAASANSFPQEMRIYSSPDGIEWDLEAQIPYTGIPYDMAVSEVNQLVYLICIKVGVDQGAVFVCGES